ncbi:MAG: hypothetical protein ABL934_06580 [Lysobacteraceae bacterium]
MSPMRVRGCEVPVPECVAIDAVDMASTRVPRRFDNAKRAEKFAHFRAIGLVRREKSTARDYAQSDAFTCRNALLTRGADIVRRDRGCEAYGAARKKNR